MPNVFISTSSFGRVSVEPLEALDQAGCSYRLNPHGRRLQPEETREFLTAAVGLRIVSRVGTGLENVDLVAAGAVLVNCARGGLVDETALAENLSDGRIGGAYLDVFEAEPYHGDLIELPTTVLSPHIGSYAAECRLQMELEAVANLVRALAGDGIPT